MSGGSEANREKRHDTQVVKLDLDNRCAKIVQRSK